MACNTVCNAQWHSLKKWAVARTNKASQEERDTEMKQEEQSMEEPTEEPVEEGTVTQISH